MGFRNPVTSLSGDDVTPGTITGSTIRTAATGKRAALYASNIPDRSGSLALYTGHPQESAPGQLQALVDTSDGLPRGAVALGSPLLDGGGSQLATANLTLASSSDDGFLTPRATLDADLIVKGRVSAWATSLHAEIVATIDGTLSNGVVASGCALTLTPGTWLVHAGAVVTNLVTVDLVTCLLWTGTAVLGASRGGAVLTSNGGSPAVALSQPTVVTVTAPTGVVPLLDPNGSSAVRIYRGGGSKGPSAWITALLVGA